MIQMIFENVGHGLRAAMGQNRTAQGAERQMVEEASAGMTLPSKYS